MVKVNYFCHRHKIVAEVNLPRQKNSLINLLAHNPGENTMAKTYQAGVKEYRETYWMPDYTPKDTDFLACFKVIPQEGVPREEAAAAVAAESSTGTWTTVWIITKAVLTLLKMFPATMKRSMPLSLIRSIYLKKVQSLTC